MPLRVDTLAMIHRNTKLSELYNVLVEATCRSLKLLESVLLEQLGKYVQLIRNDISHCLNRISKAFLTLAEKNGCYNFDIWWV